MEFSTFSHKILELATKYRKWIEPVSELTKSYMSEHNITSQDFDTRRAARNEVLTELRKKDDIPGKLTAFLDDYYELYTPPRQRSVGKFGNLSQSIENSKIFSCPTRRTLPIVSIVLMM